MEFRICHKNLLNIIHRISHQFKRIYKVIFLANPSYKNQQQYAFNIIGKTLHQASAMTANFFRLVCNLVRPTLKSYVPQRITFCTCSCNVQVATIYYLHKKVVAYKKIQQSCINLKLYFILIF